MPMDADVLLFTGFRDLDEEVVDDFLLAKIVPDRQA
jgi:hypothetical protein